MEIKDIIALVGDNAEAKTFLEDIDTSTATNVQRINKLEKTNGDLLGEVKNYKLGNTLIKSKLGIEKVDEETIDGALKSRKDGDESLLAEIENYKTQLSSSNAEKETILSESNTKFQDMVLTNSLRDLGIDGMASSTEAAKVLLSNLKNGASLDGSNIVYKNEDGTTMFNGGNAMTTKEKLATMKSDPAFSPFFKNDAENGTNTRESSNNSGANTQSMSSTEMMKQGRK